MTDLPEVRTLSFQVWETAREACYRGIPSPRHQTAESLMSLYRHTHLSSALVMGTRCYSHTQGKSQVKGPGKAARWVSVLSTPHPRSSQVTWLWLSSGWAQRRWPRENSNPWEAKWKAEERPLDTETSPLSCAWAMVGMQGQRWTFLHSSWGAGISRQWHSCWLTI